MKYISDANLIKITIFPYFLGTLALVKIPNTAIGSVGEIKAPNIKQ